MVVTVQGAPRRRGHARVILEGSRVREKVLFGVSHSNFWVKVWTANERRAHSWERQGKFTHLITISEVRKPRISLIKSVSILFPQHIPLLPQPAVLALPYHHRVIDYDR